MCLGASTTHLESIDRINHLPPELLTRVFEFAVEGDLNAQGFVVPARSTSPLLLTRICSPWRRLAASSPKLWTSLSLGTYGSLPSSSRPLLDLFLSRSGETLPLSFALTYDRHESSRPKEHSSRVKQSIPYLQDIDAIAKRLARVRHRWRRLIVHVLTVDALVPFMEAISQGTPELEYLSLSTMYTGFFGAQHWLDLRSCPQLRTVRILTPMIFFDPTLPRLEHVTSLQLHFCSSQIDAYSWISCCLNLEKLSIELYGSLISDHIDPDTNKKILLPQLTHFSLICFYGGSNPGPLLDTLVVPSLRSFSLSRCGLAVFRPDNSWRTVLNLFDRSGNPSIEELRLVDTHTSGSELSTMLQQLGGNVRYLTLGGQAVTDEILQQFYGRLEAKIDREEVSFVNLPPFCPKIESLELLNSGVSFSGIVSLATSRAVASEEHQITNSSSTSINTLKRLAFSSEPFSQYLQSSGSLALFPPRVNLVLV